MLNQSNKITNKLLQQEACVIIPANNKALKIEGQNNYKNTKNNIKYGSSKMWEIDSIKMLTWLNNHLKKLPILFFNSTFFSPDSKRFE